MFLLTRDREEKTYLHDIEFEIQSFCEGIFKQKRVIEELEQQRAEVQERISSLTTYNHEFVGQLEALFSQ